MSEHQQEPTGTDVHFSCRKCGETDEDAYKSGQRFWQCRCIRERAAKRLRRIAAMQAKADEQTT